MKLILVSPQHKSEYTVQWIEAYTPNGSLILKSGHAPIILSLASGYDFSFVLSTDEKRIIHLVRPGFLEVDRMSATALLSQEIG